MPKKSKVNKLARMSDEERARYLQHRADVEEEARRRKRELIALFIKNKLDKEEAYSRTNTAKINQGWRFILRKIKCKQMSSDIQGLAVSFNFIVERKDRLIKSLVRAIEDSDEQHRRAFQTHTETLSYFLSIGSQRLDKLQAEYDLQKSSLLETWEKDEQDITDSQYRAEFKLKLITFIQDNEFQASKNEKDIKSATAKNDARLEHEEQMRSFFRPKNLELENFCSKLREVYTNYLERHNPIMGHYHTLREKDEFYQRDIARNDVQIQIESDALLDLQKEWIKTTNRASMKINKMTTHKEELAKRYWQMKKDSKTDRARDDEKLVVMVNSSQDAIKRLEDLKAKLDKIKQMAEICAKYEEFDYESVVSDLADDCGSPAEFENLDSAMINECKEYNKMNKFMLKVNRARVQTLCLRAEKAKLTRENIQIKLYIKRYLTDLALKGGRDRPLSVNVQSEVKKLDANGKALHRPVTCIEGALSNAVLHERREKFFEKRKNEMRVRSFPRVQCWM